MKNTAPNQGIRSPAEGAPDSPAGTKDSPVDPGASNRGKRPAIDKGEVKGSGAGAGGNGSPDDFDTDPAGGGSPGQEPVENRGTVGTTTPEHYPLKDRTIARPR